MSLRKMRRGIPIVPTSSICLLYVARGLRGFGDGFAIILLPVYLTIIGHGPAEIGMIATAALLG